MADFST